MLLDSSIHPITLHLKTEGSWPSSMPPDSSIHLIPQGILSFSGNCKFLRRGGLIENVFVRNVTVGQCREAVLRINLQYENREKCKRGFDPIVRNVHLKNVTCEKSKLGVLIIGLEDDKHVYNISVEDSHFNNVAKGANDIKGAKDVTFKNLYINGELVK